MRSYYKLILGLVFGFIFVLVALIGLSSPALKVSADSQYVMYSLPTCPHCQKVKEYIDAKSLQGKIKIIELTNNENIEQFNKECDRLGISPESRGVPLLVVGNKYYLGDSEIIKFLASKEKEPTKQDSSNALNSKDTQRLGILPVIMAAFTDAINPCAFAILILLMSTLLTKESKKQAIFSGLLFVLVVYVVYLFLGLGFYKVLSFVNFSKWLRLAAKILAIILGLLNIKDAFWYGKLFVMEVPFKWRPKLKALIKSITSPISVIVIAGLVGLFLLPCTSGPYLVILGMLATHNNFAYAFSLLLLYNFVFVLPMLAIVALAYKGIDLQKLEVARKQNIKLTHLIVGIVLLILGIIA